MIDSQETVNLLEQARDDILDHEKVISRFDMLFFGNSRGTSEKPSVCTTAACIAGTLSLIPRWQERGLKAEWTRICHLNNGIYEWRLGRDIDWKGWCEMGAKALAITSSEADELFNSSVMPTDVGYNEYADEHPDDLDCSFEQAIARINALIAKYEEIA